MGRQVNINGGGVGVPPSGSANRGGSEQDISASSVLARASGYGSLTKFEQGRYHDLSDDGQSISPETDRVVMASVPPGNSFNRDHYATDPGEPRSQSDGELMAATIQIDGELRDSVTCEYSWYNPDGNMMFSGNASLDDPDRRDFPYWQNAYFYSWVGRDFSQSANPEVLSTGQHEVEFDTNYGTYTRTFDVVGPEITSCSVPDSVVDGEPVEVSARVSNGGSGSYSGEVRWAYDFKRRVVFASDEFNIGPYGTETVSGIIDTDDIKPSRTIAVYCIV